jgi:FG-GAP-like repeat/Fibronectin type III domain
MARITAALCGVLCLVSASAAQAGSLRIAWNANPESSVAGYKVRFGTAPKTYTGTLDVGNRTSYEIAGLTEGEVYFVAVQAYTATGVTSPLSAEVSGYATAAPIHSTLSANILLGLGEGPQTGAGGWFAVHGGAEANFQRTAWGRVPWPSYNTLGRGVRLASGDLDGDGLDEIVAGLGSGSNGWVAILDDATHGYGLLAWVQVGWASYATSNGEVFPAVGDLDGDSRKEIVFGLGAGGQGWIQVLDDANNGFQHLAWKQVGFASYNTGGEGATHPAVGDLDGDGKAEIVVGLGQGSAGWMQVFDNGNSNYSARTWVQVNWPAYNNANGTTFPAVGDIDGDGRGEIVAGLGKGSDGWYLMLNDATANFAHIDWEQVAWPTYDAHSGETHPAIGNVDADAAAEIVFGFAAFPGAGGWFEIRDDASKGYVSKGWRSVGWDAVTSSGSSLFPTVSKR